MTNKGERGLRGETGPQGIDGPIGPRGKTKQIKNKKGLNKIYNFLKENPDHPETMGSRVIVVTVGRKDRRVTEV